MTFYNMIGPTSMAHDDYAILVSVLNPCAPDAAGRVHRSAHRGFAASGPVEESD
jgi:hypothetical protein